jgi:hypothetical protein
LGRVAGWRSFLADDGTRWDVHETAGDDQPSLIFSARYVARRVWAFPADWCTLPDAALERLSWQR